ncbi:hypothetical protein [Mycobacterium talmoniae]|uniref:Uncharacterized protein n=1 Tax=Mycobacterium talmoniae TaxID=1858794 RepID=A0A1S1NG02_9MYCO|nr:hypothetical protein [Mycobacterium talmoniae]OHV00144.1 hypothetical protein BKN37_18480 [Mycobacterium talmoniae]
MTTSADIRKLLERREAKLTAIVTLDKDIDAARKQLNDKVEQQRKAYDALLADGFTTDELETIGITRRRKPQNTTRRTKPATNGHHHTGPASEHADAPAAATNWPENPAQTPPAAFYDGNTSNNDEGS